MSEKRHMSEKKTVFKKTYFRYIKATDQIPADGS